MWLLLLRVLLCIDVLHGHFLWGTVAEVALPHLPPLNEIWLHQEKSGQILQVFWEMEFILANAHLQDNSWY